MAFAARDIIAKMDGPVKQASSSGNNLVLPANLFVKLDLLNERRLANGTVYLRYRPRTPVTS